MMIAFSVPLESDILIKKGQEVDFTTPFIKIGETQTVEIDLAHKLSTSPKNIFQHLKKFVGENINKGDLIAQSSSLLSSRSYYSEHQGVIKEIDHNRGVLVIETTTTQTDLPCYFRGEIAEIERNIINLKVKHSKEYPLATASSYFGGATIYSQNPEKGNLSEEQVHDKVVIDDNVPSYEQAKYNALGAVGFVYFNALSDYTKAPNAKFKDEQDYKSSVSTKLPYCIIDKGANTIYFYE